MDYIKLLKKTELWFPFIYFLVYISIIHELGLCLSFKNINSISRSIEFIFDFLPCFIMSKLQPVDYAYLWERSATFMLDAIIIYAIIGYIFRKVVEGINKK